jgi:hypothetical protein
VLIKKKDVDNYFAARRGSHPLSAKRASAVAATKPSNVKRANKSSSLAAPINVPGAPAPTQDLSVPFFTNDPGFIDVSPPVVKRWAKS